MRIEPRNVRKAPQGAARSTAKKGRRPCGRRPPSLRGSAADAHALVVAPLGPAMPALPAMPAITPAIPAVMTTTIAVPVATIATIVTITAVATIVVISRDDRACAAPRPERRPPTTSPQVRRRRGCAEVSWRLSFSPVMGIPLLYASKLRVHNHERDRRAGVQARACRCGAPIWHEAAQPAQRSVRKARAPCPPTPIVSPRFANSSGASSSTASWYR